MSENSKLSRYKIGKVVECSCIDIDAAKTALLLKLNRKTVNRYFLVFRRLGYLHQASRKEQIFCFVWLKLMKVSFGIYERDGAIYAEPVTGTARLGRFRPS